MTEKFLTGMSNLSKKKEIVLPIVLNLRYLCIFPATHWPCVKKYLGTIQYSLVEAQRREMEEADTVTALASLSMVTGKPR